MALARLAERRGQFDQAEQLYQEISKKTPNDPVPYHRMAVMCAQRGRFEDAEKNFNHALSLKPDNPELLNDAGYFYYLSSRPQDAERVLRRAVEIEPNNPKYCNNLALVLGEQRRDDECLALFRRSTPGTQANVNYAFVLAQRGEYQRALEVYDHALTEDRSMRVAADAMIQLSQHTEKRPNRPATPPTDPRPMMAANSPAAPGQPYALPQGMPAAQGQQVVSYVAPGQSEPLVTVYPGRTMPNGPAQAPYGAYPPAAQPAPYGAASPVIPAGYTMPTYPPYPAYAPAPNYNAYPDPQQPSYSSAGASVPVAGPHPMPTAWTPSPMVTPNNTGNTSGVAQRPIDDYYSR
jgi:Tfp pilus assembly protein PilF